MKRSLICLCALLMLFPAVFGAANTVKAKDYTYIETEPAARGLFVKTRENTDFPSKPNLSAKALREEIHSLVEYACVAGYKSIYFEARCDGAALYSSALFPTSQYQVGRQGVFTFFDPLRELIKSADRKGIDVYAVIDPYGLGNDRSSLSANHPALSSSAVIEEDENGALFLSPSNAYTAEINVRDIKRLSERYNGLSGIVLENILPSGDTESAAELIGAVTSQTGGKMKLGAILSDTEESLSEELLSELDIVIPVISCATGFDEENFADRLSAWQKAADSSDLRPFIAVSDDKFTAEEYAAQLYITEQAGIDRSVVGSYRYLLSDENYAASLITSMRNVSDTEVFLPEYAASDKLNITRPTGRISYSSAQYFIMGTSDPDASLTVNWKNIERRSDDGVFGVLVDLRYGTNTFTFRQGSSSKTVTIVRPYGTETTAGTTTRVSSMTPSASALIYAGEELLLTCVAPSGTNVTATLGDTTVTMKQKYAASWGVPATFTGKISVNDGEEGAVSDLGPVTYRITTYGTEFVSSGNVYFVGDGAEPMAMVNTNGASVYYDENVKAGDFKAVYKRGVTDRIISSMDGYYELSSGYIKRSDVDILTGDVSPSAAEAIVTQHDERAERFVIKGANGLPYSFVDNDDGSVELTLYGLTLPEKTELESDVFAAIDFYENDDGTVTANFVPKAGQSVWAMDVFPSDNGTVIYIKRAPKLSDDISAPLSGVSVVVDPGHGGSDPGAISATGNKESDLNFANASMLKHRLEQLGAEVTLTREQDEYKTLYERVDIGQAVLPDFFISLHHNSIVEFADGYEHSGVESYYYEEFGRSFAENVTTHIAGANYDRDDRAHHWGYYVVAKNRFAPSILCEIGFVPNPIENRYISSETEIYKTANAICAAIIETIDTHK